MRAVASPGCVRRLEAWLAGAGAWLERVRYARPEAGGEVSAYRLVPRNPRGRVVSAHGAGNDALFPQVALFKALVERGFEVFAFDWDGHGAESTTRFAPDALDSALVAAVGEAERGRAELPLHLVGHSFGGSLVLHALACGAVPHAVSGVAVSAPIQVSPDFRTAVAELLGFLHPATLSQRAHYGVWGTVPAVGPLKRRAYPFRRGEEGGAFGYVGTVQRLLARLDLERTAAAVRAPVLLVYGTADRLVPMAQGEALAARIGGAELCRVPGGTHWSTAFLPAAVERVAAWVDARQGARA
ncbi:MAG TPA: alpha/beta fold hydrolase [Longimicrobium sp.]|nr:alpha/beta fold hydrolase [Longimicrobium sp.]